MLNYRPIGVGSEIGGIARYWAFTSAANLSNLTKGGLVTLEKTRVMEYRPDEENAIGAEHPKS